MKRVNARDGHEIRGFMIRLYPTADQEALLRSLECDARIIWNWLVGQTEEVIRAREAYALRNGLAPPRPLMADYNGLSPEDAKALAEQKRDEWAIWRSIVHEATKDLPECAWRSLFGDSGTITHFGFKYDYHLFHRILEWKQDKRLGLVRPCAHFLQAIAKNFLTKSDRRKRRRKPHEAMPLQVRSGQCFEIGEFGTRGNADKNFYDCRVSINGIRIRGRLPGRSPWGRVLDGVSVTRKADGWWGSIKQEITIRARPKAIPGSIVGIDVGLVMIAATSDGDRIPNPRGAEFAERIAGMRALKKDTARLELQASRRVRHELYTKLLKPLARVETIKIEALNAKIGQMGSDKVSAMRLVKSMLVDRYGDRVREVDCRFTSQDCSQCGFRAKEAWSYEHGRYGRCPRCGYTADRDVNAARNIASRPLLSEAI